MEAKHDGDGKIYFIRQKRIPGDFERDSNDNLIYTPGKKIDEIIWLCEVAIDQGDAIAKAFNRFAGEHTKWFIDGRFML